MPNNYAKFYGKLVTNVAEFKTPSGVTAWGFRVAVDHGGGRTLTVHCTDYLGDFVGAKVGDMITVDGAIVLKKREKNDKVFWNLYLVHANFN